MSRRVRPVDNPSEQTLETQRLEIERLERKHLERLHAVRERLLGLEEGEGRGELEKMLPMNAALIAVAEARLAKLNEPD